MSPGQAGTFVIRRPAVCLLGGPLLSAAARCIVETSEQFYAGKSECPGTMGYLEFESVESRDFFRTNSALNEIQNELLTHSKSQLSSLISICFEKKLPTSNTNIPRVNH